MTLEELIVQYFEDNTCTQYIGARYVPIFGRKDEDSVQWDGGLAEYEPLTIVLYQGDSYTSRKTVPAGIDISNEEYWANTGNFNGQIAHMRSLVERLDNHMTEFNNLLEDVSDGLASEISNRISADESLQENIDSEETAREAADSDLSDAIDAEETAREQADENLSELIAAESATRSDEIEALQDSVNAERNARIAADNTLTQKTDGLALDTQRLLFGGVAMPTYVGNFSSDEQHCSCCRIGDNIYTFSAASYDSTGTVRVWNTLSNQLLNTYNNVILGHANSCAYDPIRNKVWVAPISSYSAGVATHIPYVYAYDLYMNGKTDYLIDADFCNGVSFDHATNILYAIYAESSTSYIDIFSMGESDTSFTFDKRITNELFQQPYNSTINWQDFCVRDGVMFASKTDGGTFVIDIESGTITGTIRVSNDDANGIWTYGEHEGWEFDSTGRLYQMRHCSCGFTNTGERYRHSIGFVTELNTIDKVSVNNNMQFQPYGTLTMVSSDTFCQGRAEIKDINELLWRKIDCRIVVVPSGFTYAEKKIRLMGEMLMLQIEGIITLSDKIEVDNGIFSLYLKGGTLTHTGSGYLIDASNSPCYIQFRSVNGHMTQTNDQFITFGYQPSLLAVNGLDNIDHIIVNSTNMDAVGLMMGSYKVYGGTA